MAKKSKSAVSRIIADGLARMSTTRRRQDIEFAMEEQLLEVLPEHRAAYAVSGNVCEHRNFAGTARHHHRADRGIHRSGKCGSGRKSRVTVVEYCNCDEHDRVRFDRRDSVAADALDAAEQNQRNRRKPRNRAWSNSSICWKSAATEATGHASHASGPPLKRECSRRQGLIGHG